MTVAAANEDEGRYGRIDATITNLSKDEVDELNLPISRAPCAVPADTTTVEHKRAHITSATSTSGISAPGLPRRLGISPRRIRTQEFPGDKDHRHARPPSTTANTDVDSRPADVLHIIPDTNFVIRVKVSQSAGTTRARPSATRCAASGRCTPPPSSRAPRAPAPSASRMLLNRTRTHLLISRTRAALQSRPRPGHTRERRSAQLRSAQLILA